MSNESTPPVLINPQEPQCKIPRRVEVANCIYPDEDTFKKYHQMCIIKTFSIIDGRKLCTQCFHKNFLDEYDERVYEFVHGSITVAEEFNLSKKLICANCKQRLYLLIEKNNCGYCMRMEFL